MAPTDEVTMKALLRRYELRGVLQTLATLCEEAEIAPSTAGYEVANSLKELAESDDVSILKTVA